MSNKYDPNNDSKYRCMCGQTYGRHYANMQYYCDICGTMVKYRSDKLSEDVEIDDFIDCVYDKSIENLLNTELMKTLRFTFDHIRIIELSSNVMVYYNDTFYLIKNRRAMYFANGNIDIENTYDMIKKLTFRVVESSKEYLENVCSTVHPRYINSVIVIN